jgi:hypothetical protein
MSTEILEGKPHIAGGVSSLPTAALWSGASPAGMLLVFVAESPAMATVTLMQYLKASLPVGLNEPLLAQGNSCSGRADLKLSDPEDEPDRQLDSIATYNPTPG